MIIAFAVAFMMNFISYWYSDKIVLALYRAKEIQESENPEIYRTVRKLCEAANMPVPKICMANTNMPNAFATGRDPQHAAVVVTAGILNLLDKNELEGVLAHELAHVKNRDVLLSTIAATVAGAIFMLARMAQWAAIFGGYGGRGNNRNNGLGLLVVAIVAPIAAMIIQFAISRSREYHADATGARISGNPLGLASALKRLVGASQGRKHNVNPTTAHMFIVNPLQGRSLLSLFSTHPPLEERVKRLEEIASKPKEYNAPKVIY